MARTATNRTVVLRYVSTILPEVDSSAELVEIGQPVTLQVRPRGRRPLQRVRYYALANGARTLLAEVTSGDFSFEWTPGAGIYQIVSEMVYADGSHDRSVGSLNITAAEIDGATLSYAESATMGYALDLEPSANSVTLNYAAPETVGYGVEAESAQVDTGEVSLSYAASTTTGHALDVDATTISIPATFSLSPSDINEGGATIPSTTGASDKTVENVRFFFVVGEAEVDLELVSGKWLPEAGTYNVYAEITYTDTSTDVLGPRTLTVGIAGGDITTTGNITLGTGGDWSVDLNGAEEGGNVWIAIKGGTAESPIYTDITNKADWDGTGDTINTGEEWTTTETFDESRTWTFALLYTPASNSAAIIELDVVSRSVEENDSSNPSDFSLGYSASVTSGYDLFTEEGAVSVAVTLSYAAAVTSGYALWLGGPLTIALDYSPSETTGYSLHEDSGIRLLDEFSPVVHHSLALESSTYSGDALRASRGDAITAVDTGAKQFTVSGTEAASVYGDGDEIIIHQSTGNDATYTISGAPAVFGETTVITVSEAVPDATADGMLTKEQDIGFDGYYIDTGALETLFAGCTEGRVERVYSQVAGCPDAIAPAYANRPYLYQLGHHMRNALNLPAMKFEDGCHLFITDHSPISFKAMTASVSMQGCFPKDHAAVIDMQNDGLTFQTGKYFNYVISGGPGYSGDQPYSLNRPTIMTFRGAGSDFEAHRNLNLTTSLDTTDKQEKLSTTTRIGGTNQNAGYVTGWVFFDTALSDSDRDAVYLHLNNRWQCGPTSRVPIPAPQWGNDYPEGVEMLKWLQSLDFEDVDLTPTALSWDGGGDWTGRLDELATLREMWQQGPIRAGHDALSDTRWYLPEYGSNGSTDLPILDACTIDSSNPDTPTPDEITVQKLGTSYKEAFIKIDLTALAERPATADGWFEILSETNEDTNQIYIGVDVIEDLDWDSATVTWNNPPRPTKNGSTNQTHALGMVYGQIPAELEPFGSDIVAAYDAGVTTITLHLWVYEGSSRAVTLDPDKLIVKSTFKTGLFGTGTVRVPMDNEGSHLYQLGSNAAHMYSTSLPNSDGSEGNPYYKLPAMGHRALAIISTWVGCDWKALGGDIYHNQSIFTNKTLHHLAVMYKHTNELLPDDAKRGYKHLLIAHLADMAERGSTGGTFNMAMSGPEGAALAFMACVDDPTLEGEAIRALAPRAVKRMLFGRQYDGSPRNWNSDGVYIPTGYVGEANGPDISYGGYSYSHIVASRVLTLGHEEWDFLDELVDRMTRFKVYQYSPTPYGGYWGTGAGYACRTANDMTNQLGTFPQRNQVVAALSVYGRPLYRPGNESIEDMINNIQTQINGLNNTSAEKSEHKGGWSAPLYTGEPPVWGQGALWPDDLSIVLPASTNWYTNQKALLDSNDPTTLFPLEQDIDINLAHADEDEGHGPEFWTYSAEDTEGKRFGFFVEALNRPEGSDDRPNYDGWFGGKIEAFWVEGAGNLIDNRHDKTGGGSSGDPAYENTRTWGRAEQWAGHSIFAYQALTVVAVSGTEARVVGDWTSMFKTGSDLWLADSNGTSRSVRTISDVTYDAVAGQTAITLTSGANLQVGSLLVWGVSTLNVGGDGQASVFDIEGETKKVTTTTRLGASIGNNRSLAGSGEITGALTVENTFEATADGIHVTHAITADPTVQADDYFPNLWVSIPVLLNDPGSSPNEATIEFDDGGWAIASSTPTLTQYIRIQREGVYAYIVLDQPRLVRLSPTIYQQTYQDDKRLRNIWIDAHPDTGTPSLLPASTTVQYTVETIDKTGVEGTSMSIGMLGPLDGTIVPEGEAIAAHWNVQGGDTPYAQSIEVSTDGGETYSAVPGVIVRELSDGTFEGVGDPTQGGVWPAGLTHLRIVVTDAGDVTKMTGGISIIANTPTLFIRDTFTDTPGTTYAAHVPETGAWTFDLESQTVIDENGTALYHDSGTAYHHANTGSFHQIADARVMNITSGTINAGPVVRVRNTRGHIKILAHRVPGSSILQIRQAGGGPYGEVDCGVSYTNGTWTRARIYSSMDFAVAVFYDADDVYLGTVCLWSLGPEHYGNDRKAAGFDTSISQAKVDYCEVYTFEA